MASSSNKNKIDEGECRTAVKKRMKMELLNGVTDVPWIDPITRFPQNNDLKFSPQSIHKDDTDDLSSSLMAKQNLIISYHMKKMMVTLEESWRSKFTAEIRKRKEMEEEIRLKDELMQLYQEMIFLLEEMVQQRRIISAVPLSDEEDVESCLGDPFSAT